MHSTSKRRYHLWPNHLDRVEEQRILLLRKAGRTMLADERKAQLISKIQNIFDLCNLNHEEIKGLLCMINYTDSHQNVKEAVKLIVDLFFAEKLTITETAEILNCCYDYMFPNSKELFGIR